MINIAVKKDADTSVPATIVELQQHLIDLGINVAAGMEHKTRFPSQQEVEAIHALCALYKALAENPN